MNLLKMELKKMNIRPYCISALVICFCLLGLFYIFAWVPHLESGSEASEILFSSYRGIAAVGGAIALMAFSGLASAMGFGYVMKEYSGSCAILLFSYPIDRKIVVWVKTGLLLAFITAALQILLEGKRMDREFCTCSLCQMFFCPGSFQGVFEKLGILD